ncbi:hypothetical protein GIB67_021194 [Kingdonia uniflora]|uniref:RRM domain-containing protein n=1 Tax=Kingdonia uniflora TaxID=39325 RepID=A0A7J7LFP3_9MAGN|nr:hypothetical protein GIB67_021194 [Kingdonia uniflora]
MPNTEQPFRLNWALFNAGERREEGGQDHSIFVGDLGSDVTDAILQETFASKFPSVKGAKVVIDETIGRSKGYSFMQFGDDNERLQALTEMNGTYFSNRPMRINIAIPRKPSGYKQQSQGPKLSELGHIVIFAEGLDARITDEDLRGQFSQFGKIVSIKIPVGKGCGFGQFDTKSNAEKGLQGLNGRLLARTPSPFPGVAVQ